MQWWETQRENYDLWLSDAVLFELSEGNYPKKEQLLELVREFL